MFLVIQFTVILLLIGVVVQTNAPADAWSLQWSTGLIASSRTLTKVSQTHSSWFRSCSVDFRRGTGTGTGTGTRTGETSCFSSSSSSSSWVGLFGTKRPSLSSFSSLSSSSSSWDENDMDISDSLDEERKGSSDKDEEEGHVLQEEEVTADDNVIVDDNDAPTDQQQQQKEEEEATEQQVLLSLEKTKRPENNNLQQTIRGGPSMIFAMARRMLVWDDEDYQAGRVLNDASNKPRTSRVVKVLPRWHPHDGIADANPYFRTQSPVMNNKGYAVTIQRNSRKHNKPGLWRHAYRTYLKVRDIEVFQQSGGEEEDKDKDNHDHNDNLTTSPVKRSQTTEGHRPRYLYPPSQIKIRRENRHFQGALVACAKLGLWREAIFILKEMEGIMRMRMQEKDVSTLSNKKSITINEYVILLVVKACIRGMKNQLNKDREDAKQQAEECCTSRESLDSARDILFSVQEKYDISPSPMIVNPLSSAYQYMGLYSDAEKVLDLLLVPTMNQKEQPQQQQQERKLLGNTAATFLTREGIKKDWTETASTKNTDSTATSIPTLLATSSHCKDDASYNILIKNSVLQGNWESAIHSLREMTNAGYYPKSKSLNSWSEAAMKRERRPKKPQWMKQRERILMRNTLCD